MCPSVTPPIHAACAGAAILRRALERAAWQLAAGVLRSLENRALVPINSAIAHWRSVSEQIEEE